MPSPKYPELEALQKRLYLVKIGLREQSTDIYLLMEQAQVCLNIQNEYRRLIGLTKGKIERGRLKQYYNKAAKLAHETFHEWAGVYFFNHMYSISDIPPQVSNYEIHLPGTGAVQTYVEPLKLATVGGLPAPGPDMHDPRLLVDCIQSGGPDITSVVPHLRK